MPSYDPSLTMRDARARYFEDNGFGPDGGYSAAWVDFKLGPIPMPFPNTPGRVRAIGYHDLHHVVTGYATDLRGELEISAWEIGAGCKDFLVAWQLNLAGLAAGVVGMPRRTFRAFLRGRRTHSLYGRDLEAMLDRTVGDVTVEIGTARSDVGPARAADVALFALAFLAGSVIGLASVALLLVVGPPYLLHGLVRRALGARGASPASA